MKYQQHLRFERLHQFGAAEIHETADAIHLKLELPGMEALIFGCASHRECCCYQWRSLR